MRIAIVGTGYVGLVTGAVFADLGNQVVGIDIDAAKVATARGRATAASSSRGSRSWCSATWRPGACASPPTTPQACPSAEFVFICVDTPAGPRARPTCARCGPPPRSRSAEHLARGDAPSSSTRARCRSARAIWSASILERARRAGRAFAVVSNPEFLREGSAVRDFLHPDRVVLGSTDRAAAERVAALYAAARRADRDHRPPHGGDDQVRLQRLPGDEDLVHQRDRGDLRAARRRRAAGRARAWATTGASAPPSWTRASATAAPASRRTCRRWSTWRRRPAVTRSSCAR